MIKTGTVWRVEVVSSTILYADDVKQRIREALENDVEFDEILVEELYGPLKIFADEFDVEELQASEQTPA